MASTYTIKKGDTLDAIAAQLGVDSAQLATANNLQSGASLTEGNVLNVPAATGGASSASPYTGLAGLSSQTQEKVSQYGQGYTPSESVNAAQQYLQSVINGKPGSYQSQYQGQLESLYNQVMNRDPFKFDLNGDALYNQYRDQYTQMGQQAMMDTMGQAAAMTGGYGNSYAQTAGQQAYQGYLQQLNNIVPDLYKMAYDRYTQAGNDLKDQLSMTQNLENDAYSKYRDTVSDWNTERNQANDEYWNQYNADYSNYANMLNYWNTIAQQENNQYNTDREFANADRELAYNQAMAILQAGKVPSNELLAAAGISAADAKLLAEANKKSSGGGSSGSKSTGGSGTSSTSTAASKKAENQETASNSLYSYLLEARSRGMSDTTLANSVNARVKAGTITKAQADRILAALGL